MPGKPGAGGPVPKPAAQRRRQNKPPIPVDSLPASTALAAPARTTPAADASWHPTAREWFDGLAASGQAALYEPSDWAMARLGAELMSGVLMSDKPSAQMVVSILQITSSLLSTEGDRRRLRLELARTPQVDEDEQASVTALSEYMRRG